MKPQQIFVGAWLVALVLGNPASGAVRQSADYTITTETCEAGGRQTSADYTVAGAVELCVGISSNAVAAETLRHGFVGQSYDVVALAVGASPASVGEGLTRQVGAVAALDDATRLNLAPAELGWSVDGWPLASVGADGLVTAAAVYADTNGVVRASYAGVGGALSLGVQDLNKDNYGSYAADGLDDDWQTTWFGLNNPNAAPGADIDLDLQDNQYERTVGTDPTNGTSRLRFWLDAAPGGSESRRLSFAPLRPGRTYTLLSRTNSLAEEGLWVGQVGSVEDAGETRTITDTSTAAPLKFYKLKVGYP